MRTCGGSGETREDAEDLTQAFFARFLQKNYLEGLDGRARQVSRIPARGVEAFSRPTNGTRRIGRSAAEMCYTCRWIGKPRTSDFILDPADPRSPEREFDREWALALLEHVIAKLSESECRAEGKAALFNKRRAT